MLAWVRTHRPWDQRAVGRSCHVCDLQSDRQSSSTPRTCKSCHPAVARDARLRTSGARRLCTNCRRSVLREAVYDQHQAAPSHATDSAPRSCQTSGGACRKILRTCSLCLIPKKFAISRRLHPCRRRPQIAAALARVFVSWSLTSCRGVAICNPAREIQDIGRPSRPM